MEADGGQTPLVMVHAKTFEPKDKPFTVALGDAGETIVPGPETTDQEPDPTRGVFPDNTVEVMLHKLMVVPALETVGF